MNSPLLLIALEQEAQHQFKNYPVIYTGVGKVNAAYHTALAISKMKPKHIINLGSAGSPPFKVGTVVNCCHFIQRDMNATPLGFPLYVTPFDKESSGDLLYGERYDCFESGVCGTGDSFDVSGESLAYNVIDMEAYAIAKICKNHGIRFSCLKYVTDGADGHAATDWNHALSQAAKTLELSLLKFCL